MCAHNLFVNPLRVLCAASAAFVFRLAEAGSWKALLRPPAPHALGVFTVASGGAGWVLPVYVDDDSGNKKVSDTYRGDPPSGSCRAARNGVGGIHAWGPHRVQASGFRDS